MAASVLLLEWAWASTNEPFSLTSCACSFACAAVTPRALTAQTTTVTMCKRVFISKSPWTGPRGCDRDGMEIARVPGEIRLACPAAGAAEQESDEEACQQDRCEAFEEKGEHDRESVAGLHEAEDRRVLARDERHQGADRDRDPRQRGKNEDRIRETGPQQSDRRQQHEAGRTGTDHVQHEERPDLRH